MNTQLIHQLEEATDQIDEKVKKAKKRAKKHSQTGKYMAIVFVAFLTAYMTAGGLLYINDWYDTHRIVVRPLLIIKVQPPLIVEPRATPHAIDK